MKKEAASHEETFARVLQQVTSRRRVSSELENLFGEAAKVQKADSQLMKKMFVQAPAVVTQAHNLQKMASVAPNVEAFFEKNAHLRQASEMYPELKKAASESLTRPVPNLKRLPAPTEVRGAVATKSSLSGGAA
jgi:hypothetical protein